MARVSSGNLGTFLRTIHRQGPAPCVALCLATLLASGATGQDNSVPEDALFHDSHFHLTNYVQEGTDIDDYLDIMGDTVGRSTLFGIPLQQTWSYENTGETAPTYYLESDSPLYYYSFTDAHIAEAYNSLSDEQKARLDPMITGFNPADMYAADHIRRVLETYPGVFSGIGEFTIHKEFVSSKVAGDTASLTDPALDKIFDFAGETGLVVILHNDINTPFPKPGKEPFALKQLKALFERHPETTIIWAHMGLGRVVRPIKDQLAIAEKIVTNPKMKHVNIDISWDEVAKYATETPEAVQKTADLLNKYPDRFLFGSDVVAPDSIEAQKAVYEKYNPVWDKLTPEAKEKITKGNYERIFNEGRRKVRAWEEKNVKQ
ncbi:MULTISPECIES: amidohydrolase family protein [Microbulbifer]|uniref:amidohydrolase family protein n=1 Tax=Microbulbifer TaxID=48073 RepID=UPI001E542BEE|nr:MULTISPECIES: amidohydrolase family protein [Microbulbifer]UHQ55554.1 amidohydrolase [Microbulbifer sp. YPW16]